ncbi:uncharacterized protein Z519_10748 [Cladophialophora bantiana CBS 173.52]|uniref:NADH:flavin oxidoreductase/NADH oxidase N-terminal domain-containing protein n=1 Tax=Cladophialophora bantiana (strain ATCC 10958 / CBS 173.52 / CDC B-1940 / NIH 8579) TaxID=1442370 RepID=A0A0D2FQ03_CLAB1|nr:uncharacterized protein Z519_10748 [Cladophialophora bantiana CBS 173.52]KIW88702.1 hypothetical protein Z519_10748 [Cladophialophora bantiana CBS 173.52]
MLSELVENGLNSGVRNGPCYTPAYASNPGAVLEPIALNTPTLFTPLEIRSKTLKNRIIVLPMCQYSAAAKGPDVGKLTDWHLATLGHYAIKGAALIFAEATGVQPNGRITPQCPGIQLAHAGRKASTVAPWISAQKKRPSIRATTEVGGWPEDVVGPMGGPQDSWDGKGSADDGGFCIPRPLTIPEIQEVVKAFAASARRAVEAEIDDIEIHGAHGYLIFQFLSPITNRRSDDYGGSFENRTRLLIEVIRAIRAEIPSEMPLFLRISATEWMEETDLREKYGSWGVQSTIRLAALLPSLGVDLLDVSSGGCHPQQRIQMMSSSDYQSKIACQIRHTLKEANSKLLIGAVGLITQAVQARDIVDDGSDKSIRDEAAIANDMTNTRDKEPMADVILVARQFLREPEWVLKVAWTLGVHVAWPNQFWKVRFR